VTECFRSESTLINWISNKIYASPVLIDGWLGSGKTTLALTLASHFNGSAIDVDCYLTQQQDKFVEALDINRLVNDIQQATCPFVSGICMRQVHAIIGNPSALHVYVKRMANWGWADEDEALAINGPLHELDKIAPPGAATLETRGYHEKWQPHIIADAVFERFE
jgi:hypothetical protein